MIRVSFHWGTGPGAFYPPSCSLLEINTGEAGSLRDSLVVPDVL